MSEQDDAGALVAALYQARADNDLDAVRTLLHPEVVWREHEGEAGYAGTHRGPDAVLNEMLASAMAATAGTFQIDLQEVIPHGPYLAAATSPSGGWPGESATNPATTAQASRPCVEGRCFVLINC